MSRACQCLTSARGGNPRKRPRIPVAPRHLWGVVAVVLATGCGGGDGAGGITPPPGGSTVASVTVTPPSATIDVGAAVQLAATPRDANGNAIGGKTVAWSSQSTAIATVSTTGVVSGIAAGSATISATVDGKTGSAAITVLAVNTEVIASASIGPGGGTIASTDVGLTVPAGTLSDTRTIEIRVSDQGAQSFGTYALANQYRLEGFPTDRAVEVDVRLRATSAPDGVSLIAYGTSVTSFDEDAVQSLSYRMYPARDSSGWLVARIHVFGKPATGTYSAPANVTAALGNSLLDGYITGVKSADTLQTPHFELVSYGAARDLLKPLLAKYAQYIEEAYSAVLGAGYTYAYRKDWPVPVSVHPMPDDPGTYGFFARPGDAYPLDSEHGYFEFNSLRTDVMNEWPATAIHEFFHFTQAQYVVGANGPREMDMKWLKEASSTWIEEKAPSNQLTYKNTFFRSYRDSIFNGFHAGLNAKGGYGRSAIVKFVVDKWGDAIVKQAFAAYAAGGGTTESFLGAIPVGTGTWWPQFLEAYMGNQIYSLAQDELPPRSLPFYDLRPGAAFNNYDLNGAASLARELKVPPDKIGTGTRIMYLVAGPDSMLFRMSLYQANASGSWSKIADVAGNDSLVIPAPTIKEGKRLIVFFTRPEAAAPFGKKNVQVRRFGGFTDGDWHASNITELNDQVAYTRTDANDTTKIDIADNVDQFTRFLAKNGTFRRDKAKPELYTWIANPGVEDALRPYGAAVSATMTNIPGVPGWSHQLLGSMSMGIAAASRKGASLLWLLVPIPFFLPSRRRSARRVGTFLAVFVLSALVSCDIGQISFSSSMKYELQLPEGSVQFTASAEDPTVALVTFDGVPGKVTVESYRSEYWTYTRNDLGEKTDSTQQLRTGAGVATFRYDARLYNDSMVPADPDPAIEAGAGLFQLSPGVLRSEGSRRGIMKR